MESESSGPGSSLGQGHCVVFLGKTLNCYSASLHPGIWVPANNPAMDWRPIRRVGGGGG